jgi:hypothetical protein
MPVIFFIVLANFFDLFSELFIRIHEFRHSLRSAGLVHAGQDAGAFSQQDAGVGAIELIGVFHTGTGDATACGGQLELFVVEAGAAVFGRQRCDHEKGTRFFQFAVSQTVFAQQFGAAHLEPDGIDGMMYDARLIGLTVSRGDGNRVLTDARAIRKLD